MTPVEIAAKQIKRAQDRRQRFLAHQAKVLRAWRAEAKLTLERLAHELERSVSTVTRWETQLSEPQASELARMEALHPGLIGALFPAKRAG